MLHRASELLVAGCCEHGNEPWGFLRGGEFLDQLSISLSKRTLLHAVR